MMNSADWGSPFPPEEYRARIGRVKREMAARAIDTLVVTSPPNLTYLTGYDSIWYDLPVVTALAISVNADRAVFFDTAFHKELVSLSAHVDEVVYHGGRGMRALVGSLQERGWLRGRVGIERWSRSPGAPVLAELEARLAAAGADVVDGSWTVDRVRLVKSPLEIASIRQAAAIADAAMEEVRRVLRPGVTEIEVQGVAQYAMAKLNGEEPAIRTIVRSGPRAPAHHGLPTRKKIQAGEIVAVDFCASYNRYHVDLARTFAIGEPDRRWVELFEKASGSVAAVVAGVKPGDPMSRVQEVADEYIDAVGLRQYVWWIGGYDLGIAIPPDWVGHTFIDGSRFEKANYDPGTVTNYENVLDVLEGWPGGRGGSFIETFLMTEHGLEVLSKVDRRLTVV